MQLDTLQTRFVDELLHGEGHIILTGKAGTGKSTALCAGVKAALAAEMDVMVMAPTAMAASIHRDNGLESGTIHHALKWNPAREPLPHKLLSVCSIPVDWSAKPDPKRVLVVDEASMVGLWMFEILARDLGDPHRPFDGRRLVLVGDWAQLPPVVGSDEQEMAKAMPELRNFGPPDGCVLFHPIFTRRPPAAIILEETHRANSEWFAKLNELRDCSSIAMLGEFGMRFIYPAIGCENVEESVHLCFRRVGAHQRNSECLARLPGTPYMLQLRDGVMGLKEGCKVIVSSNRAGGGFINGSRAKFSGLDEEGRVLLDDGVPISMLADGNWGHVRGGNYEGDAETGRRKAQQELRRYGAFLDADARKWLEETQRGDRESTAAKYADGRIVFQPYWPILPGYAITVHKAQGMTLPGAIVEDDVFWNIAPARLPYVALSRVPDEAQVFMNPAAAMKARVRPDTTYPSIHSRLTTWNRRQTVN